jgi:hypothetical protein
MWKIKIVQKEEQEEEDDKEPETLYSEYGSGQCGAVHPIVV